MSIILNLVLFWQVCPYMHIIVVFNWEKPMFNWDCNRLIFYLTWNINYHFETLSLLVCVNVFYYYYSLFFFIILGFLKKKLLLPTYAQKGPEYGNKSILSYHHCRLNICWMLWVRTYLLLYNLKTLWKNWRNSWRSSKTTKNC